MWVEPIRIIGCFIRKMPLLSYYFLYLPLIPRLILRESLIVDQSSLWNHSRARGNSRKQWSMGKVVCVNEIQMSPHSAGQCATDTHWKWKRATITLSWVASKQINYLWTMNIAYCSQNCCCLSFISQQIWFTWLDIHFHGSWILITFSALAPCSREKICQHPVDFCDTVIKYSSCMYFFFNICEISAFNFFLDIKHKHGPSLGHEEK